MNRCLFRAWFARVALAGTLPVLAFAGPQDAAPDRASSSSVRYQVSSPAILEGATTLKSDRFSLQGGFGPRAETLTAPRYRIDNAGVALRQSATEAVPAPASSKGSP